MYKVLPRVLKLGDSRIKKTHRFLANFFVLSSIWVAIFLITK